MNLRVLLQENLKHAYFPYSLLGKVNVLYVDTIPSISCDLTLREGALTYHRIPEKSNSTFSKKPTSDFPTVTKPGQSTLSGQTTPRMSQMFHFRR